MNLTENSKLKTCFMISLANNLNGKEFSAKHKKLLPLAIEVFLLYPVSHLFVLTADRNQSKEETKGNSAEMRNQWSSRKLN